MFKSLLSHNIRQRLREGQEVISRYFPPPMREITKHGLVPTQIYPHGRNFEESLKRGTLAIAHGFTLAENARVAALGTCFAEEISIFLKEESLPVHYIELEPNRWNFSADWGRIYTIPNLLQILDYSFGTVEFHIERIGNQYFDPLREHSVASFGSHKEAVAGIKKHRAASKLALETADIITLTLGQNEAWTDLNSGIVWGSKPHLDLLSPTPARFSVDEFSYKQNYDQLAKVIKTLATHNPKVKILVTISPVPASATFNRQSVIPASFAGKCLLRAVADQVIAENPDRCFYFPSFEMSLCLNEETFRADNRHIKRSRVKKIFKLLRETYFKG